MLVKAVLTYTDEAVEQLIQSEFIAIKAIQRFGKYPKKGETPERAQKRVKRSIAFRASNIRALEALKVVCLYNKNTFRTGLLNIVKKCLLKHNIQYKEKDLRKRPEPYLILPWRDKPFTPRYYQKEQIAVGLKVGRGVIESAVGSGKTLVQGYLAKKLAVRSLFIIPASGLSVQVSDQFKVWFGTKKVGLLTAAQVRKAKALPDFRFVTVQAVAALVKTGDLSLLTQGVDALFIDEVHHAGAKSYISALKDFEDIFFRLGFTGTFVRNDSKILELWSFLSTVLHRYSAKQAIKDGFLTPLIHITHQLGGVEAYKYSKEYEINYAGGDELLERVVKIIQKVKPTHQVLILVKLKSRGGALIHQALWENNIKSTFISGDTDKKEIVRVIEKFNAGKIHVLIGSSVIGEGIDIKSAHHLLNCLGQKSVIVVVQGTGRLARLAPKKKVGYYHDFDFQNTKYLSQHFDIRKGIIEDNFAPKDYRIW